MSGALMAISPLDGRYGRQLVALQPFFSEFALIRYRVVVEVEWLRALAEEPGLAELPPLSADVQEWLQRLLDGFSEVDALRVKELERTTNHDVKAVEYLLRERFVGTPLETAREFIHFGCTSEDITNLAYGLMVRDARDQVLLPALETILRELSDLAATHRALPMLCRTHGQPASPSTLGKEIANVVARLRQQAVALRQVPVYGKMNGAVGNFNAHHAAYPDVDWPALSERFVRGLGLEPQPLTTQIEPHDGLAALFHALIRCNSVVLDFDRDVWGYISLGYFGQRIQAGEVGSSTMPHKVNPIDFENSEGNLGIANALLGHLAEKLPVSRWQRDLSDSTALRNVGVAFAHTYLAWLSTQRGIRKLEVHEERILADLDHAWEILAEPIQTVMRRYGIDNPYDRLKAFTRGRAVGRDELRQFIGQLPLPDAARAALLALTPAAYTGLAADLAARLEHPLP